LSKLIYGIPNRAYEILVRMGLQYYKNIVFAVVNSFKILAFNTTIGDNSLL